MALPLFATILLSTVAQKVVPAFATKKLGMDPKAAALLGAAAGFGVGAANAGVFSNLGSFGSAAGSASSLGSAAGGGSGNFLTNAIGKQFPLSDFGASAAASGYKSTIAPNLTSNLTSSMRGTLGNIPVSADGSGMHPGIESGYQPVYGHLNPIPKPTMFDAFGDPTKYDISIGVGGAPDMRSTWDKLKAFAKTPDQQRFLGNAASTLIEGMMQEKPEPPKPRITSSGGGGGGGGRMAPAYPGGGGGQQTQVVWGFGQGGGFNPQPIT